MSNRFNIRDMSHIVIHKIKELEIYRRIVKIGVKLSIKIIK
jgi:hypothetical protein